MRSIYRYMRVHLPYKFMYICLAWQSPKQQPSLCKTCSVFPEVERESLA